MYATLASPGARICAWAGRAGLKVREALPWGDGQRRGKGGGVGERHAGPACDMFPRESRAAERPMDSTCGGLVRAFADPKSQSFTTWVDGSSRRFWGLTSLCAGDGLP
jgi:hypothetical protein